jgi:hypothetical protein
MSKTKYLELESKLSNSGLNEEELNFLLEEMDMVWYKLRPEEQVELNNSRRSETLSVNTGTQEKRMRPGWIIDYRNEDIYLYDLDDETVKSRYYYCASEIVKEDNPEINFVPEQEMEVFPTLDKAKEALRDYFYDQEALISKKSALWDDYTPTSPYRWGVDVSGLVIYSIRKSAYGGSRCEIKYVTDLSANTTHNYHVPIIRSDVRYDSLKFVDSFDIAVSTLRDELYKRVEGLLE